MSGLGRVGSPEEPHQLPTGDSPVARSRGGAGAVLDGAGIQSAEHHRDQAGLKGREGHDLSRRTENGTPEEIDCDVGLSHGSALRVRSRDGRRRGGCPVRCLNGDDQSPGIPPMGQAESPTHDFPRRRGGPAPRCRDVSGPARGCGPARSGPWRWGEVGV